MPEGPDGKTIIIVKKVDGHGGHHGGAWKVAYADFVTAMMALFMVLWLVNSAAEPTRQRIASYFKKPGVFQKGSGTPLEIGGGGILGDAFAPPASENSQILATKRIYEVDAKSGKVREYFDPAEGDGELGSNKGAADAAAAIAKLEQEQLELAELAEQIREALSGGGGGTEDSALLGDVDIRVDQRGLLIEIMDTESGSSRILPSAQTQLNKIALVLSQLPNPIDIEGHTDSIPFRGATASRYDNWNLSSDRANAARRILQDSAVKPEQIARIVGYADQRPKLVNDSRNPANRRITISMRFTQQAQAALKGRKAIETRPKKIRLEERKPPKAATLNDVEKGTKVEPVASPKIAGIESTKEGSLRVEVGTTIPEGAAVARPDEVPSRPATVDKDKIFGRENSFFD